MFALSLATYSRILDVASQSVQAPMSKFHAMNFTGKPSRACRKANQNFSEAATVTFRYCISTYITFVQQLIPHFRWVLIIFPNPVQNFQVNMNMGMATCVEDMVAIFLSQHIFRELIKQVLL